MRFENIEQQITESVSERALRDFGVEIVEVGVKRLVLPEAVSQKVFERMKSERKAEADKFRAQGQGEATNIKSRAERDREVILVTAMAEAKKIRAEGEKEAAKYYGIFAEAPELHGFLKKLETLKQLAAKATLIIGTDTPPFDLLGRDALPAMDGTATTDEREQGQ